ncbi:MAG: hypothetical protein LBR49_04350 [Tannerella sp.]|jgi:tetratricopeptide (TPR) repeat protein|nr:hypothetical protein [Tannerella sp.]
MMAQQDVLSEKNIPDLRQMVDDYPYFHAARMLYLKTLYDTKDLRLKMDLKRMAIHIPDRAKLFFLIENERFVQSFKPTEPDAGKKEGKFELIEDYLKQTDDTGSKSDSATLAYEHPASTNYLNWMKEEPSSPETPSSELRRQELIDSFLENSDEHTKRRFSVAQTDKNEPESAKTDTLTESEKFSPGDSYLTETLANIYIKQKRYDKALEIIRKLNLKYPEKSIYFADQIRFLEKLIIYIK